jgi:hypothetical protein
VEYHKSPDVIWTHPKWMDVLFVWWFKHDDNPSGFAAKRLQHLKLFEDETLMRLDPLIQSVSLGVCI